MRDILLDSVIVAMILSAVPMLAVALVAGGIALVQAVTQIQEQSVNHLVRLITFVIVVLLVGDWAGTQISDLFLRSLRLLESGGRER